MNIPSLPNRGCTTRRRVVQAFAHTVADLSECRNGVCTIPPENRCGTQSCTEAEYCDLTNHVCQPRLADGEACAAGVCQKNSRCLCPSVRTCSTAAQRCFPGNLTRFCWGDT